MSHPIPAYACHSEDADNSENTPKTQLHKAWWLGVEVKASNHSSPALTDNGFATSTTKTWRSKPLTRLLCLKYGVPWFEDDRAYFATCQDQRVHEKTCLISSACHENSVEAPITFFRKCEHFRELQSQAFRSVVHYENISMNSDALMQQSYLGVSEKLPSRKRNSRLRSRNRKLHEHSPGGISVTTSSHCFWCIMAWVVSTMVFTCMSTSASIFIECYSVQSLLRNHCSTFLGSTQPGTIITRHLGALIPRQGRQPPCVPPRSQPLYSSPSPLSSLASYFPPDLVGRSDWARRAGTSVLKR